MSHQERIAKSLERIADALELQNGLALDRMDEKGRARMAEYDARMARAREDRSFRESSNAIRRISLNAIAGPQTTPPRGVR